MGFIKNYEQLASNDNRRLILDLIETAYASIQPKNVFANHFSLKGNILRIQDKSFDLSNFEKITLVGFGKGSAEMCRIIENILGEKLTEGFDIDVIDEHAFKKIKYTKGTHPLPSEANIKYTEEVLEHLEKTDEKNLILVVVCGGGSVLFEAPHKINLATLTKVNDALLDSGAAISEMNIVRKHLSRVKGGGLAKIVYPSTIVAMLFSDVPGNDLSVIASGPTVKDHTTLKDVKKILNKYDISSKVKITDRDFDETPSDDKYFKNVHNVLMLSNHTALNAMEKLAKKQGKKSFVLTDRLEGDAEKLGEKLIKQTPSGQILLAGGESTIKIAGNGRGGRNQALVLASLPFLKDRTAIASFGSDGWDFYHFAGAIADADTIKKMKNQGLDAAEYLEDDNSYEFWKKIGDGIETGHLESNVSDLYIVYKPN
jgi:glycerate 2-kinase